MLDKLFVNTLEAMRDEIIDAFAESKREHLRNFYVSELAFGENKCLLLVKISAGDSQLDDQQYPNYNEARWQVNYMIHQYQSMKEKQRQEKQSQQSQRQSHIDQTLISFLVSLK
jgi:hypothetical protein